MINRLKELRAKNNITQDDLAKKVSVTRQTIIAIENGIYNPSLQLAFSLARVFKLRVEEIFEDDNK